MAKDITQLNPMKLTGPRSFFTDLDPKDPDYDEETVRLKLKLQFLLKERVVIAASSLFTGPGYKLFASDEGLVEALEHGIVAPAIRNEYTDPADFFERYEDKSWPWQAKDFFIKYATHSVPWDLKENSSWFEQTFRQHLTDPQSLLRQKTGMTESMANDFLVSLDGEKSKLQSGYKYLRREHVYTVARQFGEDIHSYVRNYADLVYRISGSRVVNCDSHFPQANLTQLGVTPDDKVISDESIFWDIYVETVMSYLNSAIRLTPERLAQLSVHDILKLRRKLLDHEFSKQYDSLVESAKAAIDIHDPQAIILKQQEINAAVRSLRTQFADRVFDEIQIKDVRARENSLWQLANALALVTTPTLRLVIGVLSRLRSIPEITSLVSKSTAESMRRRYDWVHDFVNRRVGWTEQQKKALLDGYNELIEYGLIR